MVAWLVHGLGFHPWYHKTGRVESGRDSTSLQTLVAGRDSGHVVRLANSNINIRLSLSCLKTTGTSHTGRLPNTWEFQRELFMSRHSRPYQPHGPHSNGILDFHNHIFIALRFQRFFWCYQPLLPVLFHHVPPALLLGHQISSSKATAAPVLLALSAPVPLLDCLLSDTVHTVLLFCTGGFCYLPLLMRAQGCQVMFFLVLILEIKPFLCLLGRLLSYERNTFQCIIYSMELLLSVLMVVNYLS